MMLEQSLISPNFLGKESFRWFIGVVTDYKKVPDGSGGGYKAKVRIIGYHPDAKSVISDNDLPWAHVLVPLNMGSGESGTGVSFNTRGSETVIGFFLDGDNGQQPVIIGSLFSGYDIDHPNSWNDGTNGFNPFNPKKTPINTNNISSKTGKVPNSSGIPNVSNDVGIGSSSTPSQGKVATDLGGSNRQTVSVPAVCKSSNKTYSKIIKTLRSFIRALRTVQQVQNGFINPALNAISDIPGLVQQTTLALSDLFSEYIKFLRDQILKDVYKWLEGVINSLLPKDVKIFKQITTEKIADSIWCAFSKILKGVGEFIFNFLTQLIGAVTNVPICAAEAFVGSIMSTLNNEVSNALSPILDEFSSSVSGTVGQINNYVFQALNYSSQALNFLSCESAECKQVFDYEMNKGYIPQQTIDDVQRVLNYPSQGIMDGKEEAKKWLGIVGAGDDSYSYLSASYGFCDAVNLECGLPTIEFFGGGGSGATGLAVVDALGQLMGIYVLNSGTGYANPPYVSIEDPCGNGKGAQATAVINQSGEVTSVVINDPGSGYVGPSTSTSPCFTNPIDQSGSEVSGFVVGVEIIKTGIGYTSNDSIIDSACTNDINIKPVVDGDGRIIDVDIINPGTSVRVFPQLTINTQDGEGAVLNPILAFKPVEKVGIETNTSKVQKVILCAEEHGI